MPSDHDAQSRYHRQALLPGIGREGQRRLAASHAVIVGCGALGCSVADHMARAGVGSLTIIDRDVVELTNLQRQTLFDERHVDGELPKAIAARQRLAEINVGVRVEAHVADLNARTLPGVLPEGRGIDVLLDGTDNFDTRLLLNDLAVSRGVPYIYAGVLGTRGLVMPVMPALASDVPGEHRSRGSEPPRTGGTQPPRTCDPQRARGARSACLRCLFERPPTPGSMPTCETAGVLGAAVGAVTAVQAAEAIKVLVGAWDRVSRDLVEIDVWTGEHRRLAGGPMRDPECACCSRRDFAYLEGRAGAAAAVLCGRGSVQISTGGGGVQVDLAALGRRLSGVGPVRANPFLVRVRLDGEKADREGEAVEMTVFRDGRAIVAGTTRPERARALYDRYVG